MKKDYYLQALRGLAIAAVVLIHCLPQSALSVGLRPFLNWAVAMFLFLSGVLTTEERVRRGGVVKRRLLKIVPPYLLWSLVYLVPSRPATGLDALLAVVTGNAGGHMYFLFVYAQLVVLTPLLFRLLRTHRAALYAVAPCALAAWEALALLGVDAPRIGVLFPVWLVFYLFGLEWDRWRERLCKRRGAVVAAAAVFLAAQAVEGFAWDAFGDYDMATTQLRLTNMASSLAIVSAAMLAPGAARELLAGCAPLTRLGDLSFGVYLSHYAVLMVVQKAASALELSWLLPFPLLWAVVLALSVAVVVIGRRLLPQRALHVLGFA